MVSLIAQVVEHLVTGETMQMTTTSDQRYKYALHLLVVNVKFSCCGKCSSPSDSIDLGKMRATLGIKRL